MVRVVGFVALGMVVRVVVAVATISVPAVATTVAAACSDEITGTQGLRS